MGGSQRAGPHSPRGAALYCTVTACLVLTRQVNSTPPLLTFLSFLLSLSFLYFFDDLFPCIPRFNYRGYSIAIKNFSEPSNNRQLFLYTVKYGLGFVCFFVICYLDWLRKSLRRLKGFLQDFCYRGNLEEGWFRLISLVLWYWDYARFLKEKRIDAFSSKTLLHLIILYL